METVWWWKCQGPQREWRCLDLKYPGDVAIFRRPIVEKRFVHWAQPVVIRWVAKLQSSCVPTQKRRSERGGNVSSACV